MIASPESHGLIIVSIGFDSAKWQKNCFISIVLNWDNHDEKMRNRPVFSSVGFYDDTFPREIQIYAPNRSSISALSLRFSLMSLMSSSLNFRSDNRLSRGVSILEFVFLYSLPRLVILPKRNWSY